MDQILDMAALTIEVLGPSHIDDVLRLWRDAGLPIRPAGRDSREALTAQMALPYCRFIGARNERGGLVGAVIATHEGRKGWINRLAVETGWRRGGIARRLIEACEAWLFAQGVPIVAALVEGYNHPSQALFSACDYERDDTLVYFRKVRGPDV